jgi:hypothetical protein
MEELLDDESMNSCWLERGVGTQLASLLEGLDVAALSDVGRVGLLAELRHSLGVLGCIPVPFHRVALDAPVIVCGLPRTGSTLVHHLLAGRLVRHRVLRGFEAYDPVAGSDPHRSDQAAFACDQRFAAAREISPRLSGMHQLSSEGLEECTPLLQRSLACLQWSMMFDVSDYTEQLVGGDHSAAYEVWLAQLDVLAPKETRWLLKSPLHILDYGALLRAAPGASLVQIRRRAPAVLRSFLNMCLEARRIFYVDPLAQAGSLGPFWLAQFELLLQRAESVVEQLDDDRLVVVDYEELTLESESVADRLAERFNGQLARRGCGTRGWVGRSLPNSVPLRPLSAFGVTAAGVRRALRPHLGGPFLSA